MSILNVNLELEDYEAGLVSAVFDKASDTIYESFHKPRWVMFIWRRILHTYQPVRDFHITYTYPDKSIEKWTSYILRFNSRMTRMDIKNRLADKWKQAIEYYELPPIPPQKISIIKQ